MVYQSHNLQLKKDKLGNKQDDMICTPYTLHMEEDRPCEYGGHDTTLHGTKMCFMLQFHFTKERDFRTSSYIHVWLCACNLAMHFVKLSC